ncbi:hypothetical protein TNCV_4295841 [Trichonephila clavipes]|nr:hypothetical protein TNCV_4295841 [Trichonephila clavipes]
MAIYRVHSCTVSMRVLSTHSAIWVRSWKPFSGCYRSGLHFCGRKWQPHGTHIVDEFHQGEYIPHIYWSSRSPELNPIKHTLDGPGKEFVSLAFS